jgi:hypothetical protein
MPVVQIIVTFSAYPHHGTVFLGLLPISSIKNMMLIEIPPPLADFAPSFH